MTPSDRERAQEYCEMTQHHFVQEYYGDRCDQCGLFYPDGCAPWDEEREYDEQLEYFDEPDYPDEEWLENHKEDEQ